MAGTRFVWQESSFRCVCWWWCLCFMRSINPIAPVMSILLSYAKKFGAVVSAGTFCYCGIGGQTGLGHSGRGRTQCPMCFKTRSLAHENTADHENMAGGCGFLNPEPRTLYETSQGWNSEKIERRTSNVEYWWRYALSILKQANRRTAEYRTAECRRIESLRSVFWSHKIR